MSTSRPACSVVLPTMHTPSDIEPLIEELLRQCAEVGGELVVVDGTGGPTPPPSPHLQWLSMPGAGIYELRLAGIRSSRGDVVINTEDHCKHTRDWCAAVLASHARFPDADVLASRLTNGSRESAPNWAAFMINQLVQASPIDHAEVARQIGVAGISLKRRTVDALLAAHPGVPLELVRPDDLAALGIRIVADDSVAVSHAQNNPWIVHATHNYHNARAIAGQRRSSMTMRDWMRLLGAPALALVRTGRAISRALKKDISPRTVIAAAPAVGVMYAAKGVGEILGYVIGPGDSPQKVG